MRASRHLARSIWRSAAATTSRGNRAASFQSNGSSRSFASSTAHTEATPNSNNNIVVVDEYKASSKASTSKSGSSIQTNFGTVLNNPEHADDTALVDQLLAYTRELMDQSHNNKNKEEKVNVRHIVAFSGGIDSSLVLALLATATASHGDATIYDRESVHAVMGRSPAVPQDQVALARQVAAHVGVPLQEVTTEEGNDQVYIENNGQACLACKTHLYSALQAVAEHAASEDALLLSHKHENTTFSGNVNSTQEQQQHRHQLYNGTNADDMTDSTRVGLIAAQNFRVQSPLMYTTKQDVRRAARHLGLPNWNVAASPCLRSRLALGVEATQEHLERIEAAEGFVRKQLRLRQVLSETTNLRVRLLAGNRAMLEIDAELLPHVQSPQLPLSNNNSSAAADQQKEEDWENYFVQTLGFASVSTRAFRSGSVSKTEDTISNSSQPAPPTTMDRLREAVA